MDLDRAELLRLARELAEKRHAGHAEASSELERLKQSLRERAEAIAARERELAELERRLDLGKPGKPERKKQASGSTEAIVARERAALERAHALETRERELEARAARLAAETARIAEREHELAARMAEAEARTTEAAAERELAVAERELLEERERATRAVEKELAALRIQLERARPGSGETPGASEAGAPAPAGEAELHRLEARLEAREHELGLMRQRVDSERAALLARERALHRREAAEARRSFEAPLAPPSFSEGLAAFTRGRSRS